MKLKESESTQKLRGGYYTPSKLAKFISDWGIPKGKGVTNILEPSCGDGEFLSHLSDSQKQFACTAIEIDELEYGKSKKRVSKDKRFTVVNEDFYSYYKNHNNKKYDLVIGNPPYIRYQYLTALQRDEQSDILLKSKLKPNKLINAWVSFTVASIQLLADNGKIAFVIPAELLQVKYAEQLRTYMMKELSYIRILTFKKLVFPGVEQEVIILLGEKKADHDTKNQIKILQFDDVDDLIERFSMYDEGLKFQDIDNTTRKWTRYFLNPDENDLINKALADERFQRFEDIAQVDIGITTGNNKFFCVNRDTAREYDLLAVSRPLLARSVNIPSITFNDEDLENNIESGARTFLLDFNGVNSNNLTEGQRRYINIGEKEGQNEGYKTRIRNVWYQIPSIWVPDAFFLRRNYLYPKFVINDLDAVSTDTMHRIKFHEGVDSKKIILSYYNSISFAFTELEARSYGGGVLEVLPGELENVTIPNLDLTNISNEHVERIFLKIDEKMRKDEKDIEKILDFVDKEVLVNIMGIEEYDISAFRKIWEKLRTRRLGRG